MSENALLELQYNDDGDGVADEEELVEIAAQASQYLPDQYRSWFPDDYFIGILGHRGSGKDILLTRFLVTALKNGITVFTNAELHPEALGITKTALPLDLQFLLTFDPSIAQAVIGISEIGTWFKSQRSMATGALIAEDFWSQIRKRGLRIVFTNQRLNLPGGLWDQIDLLIKARDMFYSEWGRDRNLAKGVCFSYDCEDLSGIFTGYGREHMGHGSGHTGFMPGTRWTFNLFHAERLWPCYRTEQIFEPGQWAKKFKIDAGDEIIVNPRTGESYAVSEKSLREDQRIIEQYQPLLRKYWRNWQSGFLDLTKQHGAIADDLPDRLIFSVSKLRKMIASLKGKKKTDAQKDYEELRELAGAKVLARFTNSQKMIELARPLPEGEQV